MLTSVLSFGSIRAVSVTPSRFVVDGDTAVISNVPLTSVPLAPLSRSLSVAATTYWTEPLLISGLMTGPSSSTW